MIRFGHNQNDIKHYTQRQIALFYDEALRQSLRDKADRIEDTAIGVNGGKNTAEYIKKLRED